MRRQNRQSIICLVLGLLFCSAAWADPVSLRGNDEIKQTSKAPDVYPLMPDRAPVKRQYRQQPPIIPHRIRGYKINLRNNKCLTCHSWKNAVKSGATKISLTHFRDRDGNELGEVAPRRYFCTQCHVTQKTATPLVDNIFKPVESLDR